MNITGTNNNLHLDPNLLKAGYAGTDGTKTAADAKQAELVPILFGSNVLVSYGITDIEALVAQLKNENADARVAMKLKSLGSIAEGLSSQQLNALGKALALADSVKQLEAAQNDLKEGMEKSQAEIAALAIQIESLEKQIENARANAEDYNKNIREQKAKKAEIETKIQELEADTEADRSEEIAELRAQADALDASIKTNEDALKATESKIVADNASLSAAKAKTDRLEKSVEEAKDAIDRNKNEIAGLNLQMSACLGSIDTNTLKTIAKEIAAQAVEDPERAESPHDAEKREEKAEALDVARAIRDSLDAIAKDIIQEIAERRVDMV